MTGLCKGKFADESHLDIAKTLFDSVGMTVTVEEKRMDAVTGLSASGPAFVYIILESLAEGGVKVGLPRDVATLLAAQTVQGAARMVLETGQHPALLKDAVTTPAGCTVDGILELEEGKLRPAPGTLEGCRYHTRRLYRGWDYGAGRGKATRYVD
jgi:pyrroline-5-carboxylate reductase